MDEPLKSGFVCLVGRPNVGKSTLLNRLVGREISITAPQPQTTRNRILGVKHGQGYQAVFVDTPGIHIAEKGLNRRMVSYAAAALADADLLLMLVEPLRGPGPEHEMVLRAVRESGRPALLVINKIDTAPEAKVLEAITVYGDMEVFEEVLPLSALTGRGVEPLERLIPARLPEGPPYFEEDQFTDQPERLIIAEFVRQEIFRRTGEEIPYSVAVRVEGLEDRGDLCVVAARIYVERDSQKGILIGKGGRMLKTIGQAARRKIERLLGVRLYLGLQVSVRGNWSRDPRALTELGYPEI